MGDQTSWGHFCAVFNKLKPYLAMISLQFGFAGMYIITMLSMKRGLSHYVLAVYRHAAATIAIAPFALIFERKIRPKMTLPIFLRIMLLGLLEPVIDQNLYYVGMKYTSASFASAIFNVVPAITFIFAVIFRLEPLKLKKIHSLAKVIGTVVTLAGAMGMTVYKGPVINFFRTPERTHHETSTVSGATDQHWVPGTLMLLASCTGWSAFFILQSFTLKKYPAELSLTSLICLMGMVQGGAVALVMERDYSAWIVGFDSRLLAAVYTGVVCSGIAYCLQGVVMKQRGPVFATAFNPLCMIIVTAAGSILLAEKIHLGSIIGAIIIVAGLYCVVWGKSKDIVTPDASFTDGKTGAFELPVAVTDDMKSNAADNKAEGHIVIPAENLTKNAP